MEKLLLLDGSYGEGGGQILRASLALSIFLRTPFRMVQIRANRPKPGLRPQHLACVRLAKILSQAEVEGDELSSQELIFRPKTLIPGSYEYDIGSAGSIALLLQAVLPPLLVAEGPSTLTITGGTHVPKAPSIDFLKEALFPLLEKMGPML
ncbi:MAG: RNA 3'-terminal phosphate cyclase, partial [Desulfovibrionaceae bacterium]|nr:RNA 3'-terminal phosphate cyclase [Desulfovibrionaceae bacterium]